LTIAENSEVSIRDRAGGAEWRVATVTKNGRAVQVDPGMVILGVSA